MNNKTIIYYTSNIEDEKFENKIVQGIMDVKGDIPVISVSQKPMNFGENICVGDVGYSYVNAFRQLRIGCEKAKTPFVIMAESDCLYPKSGYFDFVPTDPNVIYNFNNVWIFFKRKPQLFYRKYQTHGSIIYGREYLMDFIDNILKDCPIWTREKIGFPWYGPEQKFVEFGGEVPIINVITGANNRRGTHLLKQEPVGHLPYWGTGEEVKKKYEI